MITKVFRTMHASDGKFTYTDQDGNIILASSKSATIILAQLLTLAKKDTLLELIKLARKR